MGAALDDRATDREIDREHKRVMAAVSEARKEGMERAAGICDRLADEWLQSNTASVAGEECATAIRAAIDSDWFTGADA